MRRRISPRVPKAVIQKARELAEGASLWIPKREMHNSVTLAWGGGVQSWLNKPSSGRWVFFCNDDPGAMWEHDARLLLITSGLDVEVRNIQVPPENLRKDWREDPREFPEVEDDAWTTE